MALILNKSTRAIFTQVTRKEDGKLVTIKRIELVPGVLTTISKSLLKEVLDQPYISELADQGLIITGESAREEGTIAKTELQLLNEKLTSEKKKELEEEEEDKNPDGKGE